LVLEIPKRNINSNNISLEGFVMEQAAAQGQEHHHAQHSHHQKVEGLLSNKLIFAVVIIIILSIAVYSRMGLVKSQGLFEPDGFFYYSVVRATLLNPGHSEPQYLGISGFGPNHNFIGEAPGLPYLTVIFYTLLSWTGASALAVMRMLPVLVAIIEVILAYFIAKELSNSRLCGVLAMFFVAVSAGNIARTAALVYRGDTFIGIPIMLAILVLLWGFKQKSPKRTAIYALVASFILSTGALIWNGSPFIVVIYMISLGLMAVYAFITWKPELAKTTLIFAGALFIVFLLQNIYLYLHAIRPDLSLVGFSFLAFYIPILVGSLLAYWLIKRGRVGIFHTLKGRILTAVLIAVIFGAIVAVAFHGYVTGIATASGVYVPPANSSLGTNLAYAIGSTTQELQKPTFGFLFASFGMALYLGPLAIILFLLFNRRFDGREEESKHVLSVPFLVMLAYLVVTAYLQYNAIRYNSLLSVPLAIFAAYAVYMIFAIYSQSADWAKRFASYSFVLGIAAGTVVLAILLLRAWIGTTNITLLLEGVAALLVAAFITLDSLSRLVKKQQVGTFTLSFSVMLLCAYILIKGYQIAAVGLQAHLAVAIVEGLLLGAVAVFLAVAMAVTIVRKEFSLRSLAIGLVCAVLIFSIAFTLIESYSSAQADGINPAFLSAMTWMRGNTPTNATVLALWPDGSVVEAWANRTSYMDSVGGENGTRIYYFARYLENTTADSQYLYSIGKPEYIVARQYWLTELAGLVEEGVPSNPQQYTFTSLQAIGQPEQNATSQVYFFSNGYYNVTLVTKKANATTPANYSAYLGAVGQLHQYKITRVNLYNTSSTRYSEYNQTAAEAQLNYTLMIFYSGSQIEGAIILTNTLYESNLFKLVWLCDQYQCPYSNSTARITPVFINNDTRIFRVNYT
jgi:hypothetical protein